MELRRYLRLLRQRVWIVLFTVGAGLAAAYALTPHTPVYQASATIYVGTKTLPFESASLSQQATGLAQISNTFAAMVSTHPIAEMTLRATHINRSTGSVVNETKAQTVLYTNLIKVTVRDRDRIVAAELAERMSQAFVREIQTFEAPTTRPNVSNLQPAYVFEHATLPNSGLYNGWVRNLIWGGLFGLIISVAAVLLLDYLDITVKSPEEIERRVDLPVLGVIPLQRQLLAGLNPIATPRRSAVPYESRA